MKIFRGVKNVAVLFIVAASCMQPASSFAKDCTWEQFSFSFGNDTSTKITVKNTGDCVSNLRSGSGVFTDNRITLQAQHGVVTSVGKNGITYKPRAGYVGPDKFIATFTGESPRAKGSSNLIVDVTVTP